MDYRWKVTNTGRRSPGTRVPMVAQILQRNVHVVKSMLPSAAAPPSSVMNSRLSIFAVIPRRRGQAERYPQIFGWRHDPRAYLFSYTLDRTSPLPRSSQE